MVGSRAKPTVRFLGAAETVTGSKHLVEYGGRRVLLDCGLFQGLKKLRERNWQPLPVTPRDIDAVILSHAHIDHSGYLPRLVREGFSGPIYCTPATASLLHFLLRDSAHLQEEHAAFLNRHKLSKHEPALPLYTGTDADEALRLVRPQRSGRVFSAVDGVEVTYRAAGHILGASTVDLTLQHGGATRRVVFSGDLGRYGSPILKDPEPISAADVLLMECTYGDKRHPPDPDPELARIISQAAERGGAVIIPAFAVGRTQEVLFRLKGLEDDGRIPKLPVYVDSPMAIDVTTLYRTSREEHDDEMRSDIAAGERPLTPELLKTTSTPQESKAINDVRGPIVIISASGMATGGRVLHHLKLRLPDKRTTILFTGFQAAGSRGRILQDGAGRVRIHGKYVSVRAHIETVGGLSAHADQAELMRWFAGFEMPPPVYLVHGERDAARSLARLLTERFETDVTVAKDQSRIPIPG